MTEQKLKRMLDQAVLLANDLVDDKIMCADEVHDIFTDAKKNVNLVPAFKIKA